MHRELGVRFVDYRSRLRLLALVREVEVGRSLSRAAAAAGFGRSGRHAFDVALIEPV